MQRKRCIISALAFFLCRILTPNLRQLKTCNSRTWWIAASKRQAIPTYYLSVFHFISVPNDHCPYFTLWSGSILQRTNNPNLSLQRSTAYHQCNKCPILRKCTLILNVFDYILLFVCCNQYQHLPQTNWEFRWAQFHDDHRTPVALKYVIDLEIDWCCASCRSDVHLCAMTEPVKLYWCSPNI